jgi:hypothetical protein
MAVTNPTLEVNLDGSVYRLKGQIFKNQMSVLEVLCGNESICTLKLNPRDTMQHLVIRPKTKLHHLGLIVAMIYYTYLI